MEKKICSSPQCKQVASAAITIYFVRTRLYCPDHFIEYCKDVADRQNLIAQYFDKPAEVVLYRANSAK